MSKLRESARDEICMIRYPGICNFNSQTTVLAHLPDGSGTGHMAGKSNDLCSVYACSACHDVLDGRALAKDLTRNDIIIYAYEGHMRTLVAFERKGLVTVR
jgi:hypothetical protein